jgi:hypothetical protein
MPTTPVVAPVVPAEEISRIMIPDSSTTTPSARMPFMAIAFSGLTGANCWLIVLFSYFTIGCCIGFIFLETVPVVSVRLPLSAADGGFAVLKKIFAGWVEDEVLGGCRP